MHLKGKKALVTGASTGIGKEIAKTFVKNGANVVIFATNLERLNQALKELNDIKVDENQKILAIKVDVSNFSDVEKAVTDILLQFGSIDILVNNAGITKDNLILRMSENDFDRVIEVNLKSVYNTCKVLTRSMMKKKTGKIINISSVVGIMGNPGQANYAASKAAIDGFTRSLAKELGSRNICVNSVAPGFIETKMTDNLPDTVKQEMLKNIPLKRFGKTQDVANLVLFLASNMSDYITGQTLVVDGGMVMN